MYNDKNHTLCVMIKTTPLLKLTLFLSLLHFSLAISANVKDLKCEHLINPIGIDAPNPRLSWRLDDSSMGAQQTAYQIIVGTDSLQVLKGIGNVWETLKTLSNAQLITYQGNSLKPFTKYFWTVLVWNQKGETPKNTPIANFEMGMMSRGNWQGAWISDSRDVNNKVAPYFRKSFPIGKKIVSARAYIAVAGLYELSINGQKVSNHRLDPMYTRFDRRTLYVTHDITPYLQQGKNAVGVLLGNGWYNHQSTAVWYFDKAPWRGRPTFCMDIRVKYDDNTEGVISSGKDWKTAPSPTILNSIYTAEHYDARLEKTGWNTPNYVDSTWKEVVFRSAPSTNIVAQALHPIRDVEEISPKTMRQFDAKNYVFDLGRNIAGVTKITVRGASGTIIKLKQGERIYENGHVDLSNIDVHYRPTDDTDPFQTDIFILSGSGEETFKPKFNYKGFQYIEVTSDKDLELTKDNIKGYFMHSDVPPIGKIHTSNPTINKIWEATNNAYLSNLFGLPTDCPQREKNGWTGDAHIASETGLYNFDGITIYEKWLADHRDEQQANGVLPSIIPSSGWGYEWGNGPDWTSTIAIIPWNIYLFYGDKKLLTDCYDNIKRYVDHITDIAPTGLTTWGLGDWVPVKSKTPVELTSTTYYFVDVKILANTAKLLGKTDDFDKYSKLADKIQTAFNAKYLDKTKGIYGSGFQTEMSVPLYWGLVSPEMKSTIAANLAKRVEADGNHLDVGLLGTKAILNALSENGYADLAYKIAAQETFPSWGWWIKNGATTLYENWPIDAKSDISMNHIMFGEIGAWFYKGLGGIKPDPQNAGFKNILLEPHFVEGLNEFEASFNAPTGRIESSWKTENGKIIYQVTIPPNSTATLTLSLKNGQSILQNQKLVPVSKDNAYSLTLVSGKYTFEIK
jgi:alpha-L-rhamnosidase